MKIVRVFIEKTIALISVLFAVSSFVIAQPEVKLGENVLKEEISNNSRVPMTIKGFSKTNGIMREINGQPIYTMEFTAKIQIEQKCGTITGRPFFRDFMPFDEYKNYINNIYYANSIKILFYSTANISYDGEIVFEKTEMGWRSTNITFKNFKLLSNEFPLSEYSAVGTVKNFKMVDGDIFLYMLSTNSQEVIVEIIASNNVSFNFNLSEILKVGVKIAVMGEFKDSSFENGKQGLVAKQIKKL